ncbi:MAG: amidohydrolase family protein [Candidatus Dormibacteria bacterium]
MQLPPPTSPAVDAHVHVMPDRVRRDVETIAAAEPWFAACHVGGKRLAGERDLLEYMDGEGIDRAVVFTWPFADPRLCAEANGFVGQLQRRHPNRVIGCGIVQPASPDAAAELERCAGMGLAGIGELNADAQGWDLEGDGILLLAARSASLDLPWTLHCGEPVGHDYPGKGTVTPERLARFAARLTGLRLVAAHLGGGLPFHARMPEVRELCRSLWFDIAALPFVYGPGAVRDAVDLVGADRLLLGTDFPLLGVDRYRQALEQAGVAGADLSLIMGENAASVWQR